MSLNRFLATFGMGNSKKPGKKQPKSEITTIVVRPKANQQPKPETKAENPAVPQEFKHSAEASEHLSNRHLRLEMQYASISEFAITAIYQDQFVCTGVADHPNALCFYPLNENVCNPVTSGTKSNICFVGISADKAVTVTNNMIRYFDGFQNIKFTSPIFSQGPGENDLHQVVLSPSKKYLFGLSMIDKKRTAWAYNLEKQPKSIELTLTTHAPSKILIMPGLSDHFVSVNLHSDFMALNVFGIRESKGSQNLALLKNYDAKKQLQFIAFSPCGNFLAISYLRQNGQLNVVDARLLKQDILALQTGEHKGQKSSTYIDDFMTKEIGNIPDWQDKTPVVWRGEEVIYVDNDKQLCGFNFKTSTCLVLATNVEQLIDVQAAQENPEIYYRTQKGLQSVRLCERVDFTKTDGINQLSTPLHRIIESYCGLFSLKSKTLPKIEPAKNTLSINPKKK